MLICNLGPYTRRCHRRRVIIKGLRKNDVDVIDCNDLSNQRLLRYLRLVKKYLKTDYDITFLGTGGYSGHPMVPLAKTISRKPIIFDAFLGLHETHVIDTEYVRAGSLTAKLYHFLDLSALKLADLVLTDTNAHIGYFHREFGLKNKKFRRIFVGSDDEVFYPRKAKKKNDCFLVLFWGQFIPLQGIEHIIQAAKLLEDQKEIHFKLIGYGQTYDKVRNLSEKLKVKNVGFHTSWVRYEELPNYVARADVCLGIFGDSEKAQRVIPNKAYESIAMKKPLITEDSPAAREVFRNHVNCVLCKMAEPHEIADAILMLKDNKKLRDKIAENGYRLFREKFTPKAIGKELKRYLYRLAS